MQNRVRTILALTAAALAPVSAIAGPADGYEGYGPHMMWGGGWAGWIFGPVMMLLVIAGIVAAVVIVARSVGHSAHAGPGATAGRDPIDILKERFARGEIDKDEFEERRRVLGD